MSKAGLYLYCCVVALSCAGLVAPTRAEPIDRNKNTVTLLSGEPAWMTRTLALTQELTHENGLRVLPMLEKGCIDAAAALLQSSQVDVALLTTDCVSYAQQQGLLPGAERKLAYVAKREALPLVLVTSRSNATLTSLAGKRIATGPAHSAAFASGEILLGALGLPFQRLARSGPEGIDLLKRGEADAVLLQGLDALDGTLDPSRFHVLGLIAPTTDNSPYAPALVEASALKGLSAGTDALETVSTALVLAVVNGVHPAARTARLKLFTTTYFQTEMRRADATQLSATVEGWQRLAYSQQALENLTTADPDFNATLQQGDGP